MEVIKMRMPLCEVSILPWKYHQVSPLWTAYLSLKCLQRNGREKVQRRENIAVKNQEEEKKRKTEITERRKRRLDHDEWLNTFS